MLHRIHLLMFWTLPDSPSGVSIFYCPETKSSNSFELERERNLALAEKVNNSDLEKLAKQKISLPTSLMDLVWSTQNLHAVIALCFGPDSHSATFLQNWTDHMYENRLLYTSLQSSDPYFFAKVMFTIDNALQIHWRSCSSAPNRSSVNDNILRMTDTQDSILRLNFSQMLPKAISDKVQIQLGPGKEEKEKGMGHGRQIGKHAYLEGTRRNKRLSMTMINLINVGELKIKRTLLESSTKIKKNAPKHMMAN